MTTHSHTTARAILVALLAALAATVAAPLARADGAPAPAGARLAACHRSPSIDQRVAVVATWMRPLPNGRRLALRIDLWQRMLGGKWTQRTDVPGLGSWTTPSDAALGAQPGDVFKYRQAVGRLLVPAAYRFHVSFRWSDANGVTVREASATTRTCREPDVRPDLVLEDVQVAAAPRGNGLVRYTLLVGNEGRSPVARATIAATFPGETTPGSHVRGLGRVAPGETTLVKFTGPGCAAGGLPASFLADPSNAIDESDETNNGLAATCPAP